MTDIFSKEKRSEIMSHIKSVGLKPEQKLYAIVRNAIGYRWRIEFNNSNIKGKPDIVIPSLFLIIFADGCFFHGCPLHGHLPKSNRQYWKAKLEMNRKRDKNNNKYLRRQGYGVWRIWEHELKGRRAEETAKRLKRRLSCRIGTIKEAGSREKG